MDIWASHATRIRSCINCTHQIDPGDRVIVGQTKRTYEWGTRTRRVMSHLDCWYSKTLTYLDDHPYEPRRVAGPGRPSTYTGEQRKKRLSLQVRISQWTKKRQSYVNEGMWSMADRYGVKMQEARKELESMV